MTGESIPTKENWRKLLPYYKKLIGAGMIVLGAFLMLEHLFQFGGFDMLDFIGHEYYGVGLILGALLLCMKWGQWKELELWKIGNWFR